MRSEKHRKQKWLAASVLITAVLLSSTALNAAVRYQAQTPPQDTTTAREKAALWVRDYKSLPLVVEGIEKNTQGLDTEAVRTKAELRLRSAGIRPFFLNEEAAKNLDYFLYVQVSVLAEAFDVRVEFKRMTRWELPNGRNYSSFASTWDTGRTGIGPSGAFILGSVDRALDIFLNDYLKANQ